MSNFNKVLLLGNLTRDVELRHTQGGTALAKFGMAINRKWSQEGVQKESVCFVDLTAWGRQAEVLAQYVKKGSKLFVEGRLEYSTWEGDDGKKKSKLDVVVETFQFVGDLETESEAPAKVAKRVTKKTAPPDPDYGDIPFAWLIALPLLTLFF